MIATTLLLGLIVGALLSGAAALAERSLRLAGMPARLVWVAALTGTLVMPLYAVRRSRTGGTTVVSAAVATPSPAADERRAPLAFPTLRIPSLSSALDLPLGVLWLAVTAAIASATGIGLARLGRERRRWASLRVDGRAVLVSDRFGPAVLGLVRPEIVLPRWTLTLDAAERRLVVAHEDEHRRAHDPALLAIGALAVAASPLNPCVWWQARRLRAAVELDCDGRVLRRGAEPVSYGRLLLRVGSRTTPERPLALPIPALKETTGSILERRLQMITYERRSGWIGRAGLAVVGATMLIVIACETPTPTVTESKRAPALHSPMATPPAAPGDVVMAMPLVLIDGVESRDIVIPPPPAPRDYDKYPPRGDIRLWGLDPNTIERIEVLKGNAARAKFGERGKHGVILITTKKTRPIGVA